MNILKFWFPTGKLASEASFKLWFMGDSATDRQIKEAYEQILLSTTKIADDMNNDPEAALSNIILLDQFPRNIYRGSGRAFAFDHLALSLAKRAVDLGLDKSPRITEEYGPAGRAFIYLPFEHSEDAADQARSVGLFEALYKDHPGDLTKGFLKYAVDHQDLITRFGRFPHRNGLLGRQSTPEEIAFLEAGGQTYGTSKTGKDDL